MSATPVNHRHRTGRGSRCRRALAALALAAIGALLAPAGTAAAAQYATVASGQAMLRQGDKGPAVERLQRELTALRYDIGGVDGIFGPETHHGVVAFQKVNGLATDGIVGPRTRAALADPKSPRPQHTHSVVSVEVDLGDQVLFLAKRGKVLRILDASTGKASTPTPRGDFRMVRRIDGWRKSDLGLLWRPYYFYGGYAVHGSKAVPDYPASHGCVRVTVKAMNRLWSQLRIDMPVHVHG